MCLKIKIFSGYIILIFLLVLTICLFRKEQMKRNYLQQDEQELLHFWHLTGEAYAGLLNLATYGETRTTGVLIRKGETRYAAYYSP